jgi:hypothetical protein
MPPGILFRKSLNLHLTSFNINVFITVMNLNKLIERANGMLVERGLDHIADGRVSGLFSERTVRFMRQAGVISRPEGQGPAARWSELHMFQLIAARTLQTDGLSISEVRDRINGLDIQGLQALLQEQKPSAPAHYSEPCSSWHVAPGFILVSTRRQSISPAVLQQINRLLTE